MNLIATAMVTSLGYDVHTACAASRAGLTRAAELPFVVPENDNSPGLAIGHPATLLGGGFEGDARLVQLLVGAFRDLAQQLPGDILSSPRLGLYLALPAGDRERQGLHLVAEDVRALYLERLGRPSQVDDGARARRILDSALRMANLPAVRSAVEGVHVSTAGHAGVIELYESARDDLDSGRLDLALVGGVDSLVGHATLRWLHSTRRLKSAESPAGLAPGEAAAFVALRRESLDGRQPDSSRARVDHVVTRSSKTDFWSGDPADGRTQFQILDALRGDSTRSAEAHWVIADQNGEVFRASDWGWTLVRLRAAAAKGERVDVWYPPASFGDVGAASGALATCLAVEALERGYAPSSRAMLLTNSDSSARAGCLVSSTEASHVSRSR